MKKPILILGINFVAIGIVIAGLSVGNNVLNRFEGEINTALCPPIVDTESMSISSATGQKMSTNIMEEGAVLLKNDNNTLPLNKGETKKVNVFGWRSIDWIYGSEGQNASGGVAPENDNFDENIDIYKALNKHGVSYNTKLYDMYYRYERPKHLSANLRSAHISTVTPLREPKIEDTRYYTDDLLTYSKDYSDTAIVCIGRMAGEGMNANSSKQIKQGEGASDDDSRHYLEITTEEESLLKYCGENFENVVVLLNVANQFECGFLNDIEGLDSCLYIGFTGTRGANAIPSLLYGDVSPSGHTVDTFAYDLFTNPANLFYQSHTFTDYGRSYSDYAENIYVGYKWYETADKMGVWNDVDNTYGKGYDGIVQFPFGYGMSYTNFEWQVGEMTIDDKPFNINDSFKGDSKIKIPVTVTNVGEHPGKEVVQIYTEVPYTKDGIEKPSVILAAFGKTNTIKPSESETIVIEVNPYDFASYDCYDLDKNDFKGWELESGTYNFNLQTDSHNIKNVKYKDNMVKGQFTFKVDTTINFEVDPVTNNPVGNLFTGEDAIDRSPIDGNDGEFKADIPWITRSNMKKPQEYKEMVKPRAATPSAKFNPSDYLERAKEWDDATTDEFGDPVDNKPVTWGSDGDLKITNNGVVTELGYKLGGDYDAPEWEDVLNQVTIPEAINMVNNYYGSDAVTSIGKPFLADFDGPAQIKGFTGAPRGTGYPTMVVLAATWNQKLAYEFGKAYGDDMKSLSVYGVWGWAIDNHRSSWFGRNHESPSEDTILAGRIVANAVKGLNTRGRYSFLKHFALYGAAGDCQFVTEQALRENYLKSFRLAFVEGGALGCMTTYQGVGAEHSETTVALLNGVLRKEWGFKGAITTDYIGQNAYIDSLIRCSGNLGMGVALGKIGITYDANYLNSKPRISRRLREATKQTIYTYLHSQYNEQQYLLNPDKDESYIITTSINGWQWWKDLVKCINICAGILLTMWGLLVTINFIFKLRKNKETPIENKEEK